MNIPGQPLVSVLMTTYNREKYIVQAIESVLQSSYKNFELIVVDDGSRDRTVIIAKEYAAKDARIRVYENEKNLGDYPNRNKAASHATGKYLKYVDADDAIYPWGLELLVGMMEQYPEAGWGLCSLEQYREKPFPFILGPEQAYRYHYEGPGLFHKAPLSSIFRRDIFEEVGGFSGMRMVGDFEMWHRLATRYPVLLMPQGMVWYREHSEQEMTSYNSYLTEYEKVTMRYLTEPNCPLGASTARGILGKRKRDLVKSTLKAILKLRMDRAKLNWKLFKVNYVEQA